MALMFDSFYFLVGNMNDSIKGQKNDTLYQTFKNEILIIVTLFYCESSISWERYYLFPSAFCLSTRSMCVCMTRMRMLAYAFVENEGWCRGSLLEKLRIPT